jgi:hypothetical protein
MNEQTFTIEFHEVSNAEAAQYAAELKETISNDAPEVKSQITKADLDTMDAGSILQIILNAGSVIAVAGGIAAFIRGLNIGEVMIKDKDRILNIKGRMSENVKESVEAFLKQNT